VFHQRFMPSSAPKRERLRRTLGALLMLVGCLNLPSAAEAAGPRIASINACTDQLLMALADPEQILGLSPYARDPARSWDAAKARQYQQLSGAAEDVLILEPDVVVAGRFTRLATRQLLKDKNLRVVEFDVARSLDDVKKSIRLMGDVTRHPDRAAAEIARLDAAIAHAHQAASRKPWRVLAVWRGGFASLESIISLRPDFILVSEDSGVAEDEGSAFLLHPALERFYPPSKRIVIPERLTVCGGPMLTEALEKLASELERVDR
jgi:iron complex transport system substrate-binding protein